MTESETEKESEKAGEFNQRAGTAIISNAGKWQSNCFGERNGEYYVGNNPYSIFK